MAEVATQSLLPSALLETLPSMPADLYPLPLTAFEKYLIWDETPAHPMTSFIELHFLDPLQLPVMESALAAAATIHPQLLCTIQELQGQWNWIHHPDFRHRLELEQVSPPMPSGHPQTLNLQRQPGIRFWYRQDQSGSSRILIQLHHATADGVGLRRFLIDAMTLYAQATAPDKVDSGVRPPWSKIDLALLKVRHDFSTTFGGPPHQPLTIWQRLKNAYFFHFQLPKPLRGNMARGKSLRLNKLSKISLVGKQTAEEIQGRGDELCEPLEHLVIDRQTSTAILEKARLSKVGINELCLALLFESCCLWNQQHGDRNPQSRLRILMPYDLRSRIDLKMPAANRLSFSFLGRVQADCRDRARMIESVGAEIQRIKDSQLPLDFLAALDGAARHPRLMRWAIARSRNMATAVLTYAGDISRGMQKYFPEDQGARIVGDVRLDKILAAPPVRDNTHWSLGVCINWGQICISAAFNRDGLTRLECRDLMQLYHSRWLEWLKD